MKKNVFLSCLSVAVLALSFFALASCDNWKDGWEDEWSPEDNYPARSFVSPFYMGSSEGMVATNPIKCSWTGGNFSSVKEFAASDRVTSEFLDIETAYTWWTEPASVPGFSLSVSADTKKCDFVVTSASLVEGSKFKVWGKETKAPAGTFGGVDPVTGKSVSDEEARKFSYSYVVRNGGIHFDD